MNRLQIGVCLCSHWAFGDGNLIKMAQAAVISFPCVQSIVVYEGLGMLEGFTKLHCCDCKELCQLLVSGR